MNALNLVHNESTNRLLQLFPNNVAQGIMNANGIQDTGALSMGGSTLPVMPHSGSLL